MISNSAVLAWKFPVMNGIVCEGEMLVKWDIPTHPEPPNEEEITTWRTEYTTWALANSPSGVFNV